MATTTRKQTKPVRADEKSEFLTELVERYSYWVTKGNKEFAAAYEHMICAFTTPDKGKETE